MEEIVRTYASNIRRFRTDRDMTQAFLADRSGITEKYMSDIETGRKSCSLDTLVSIANVLDIDFHELFLPESRGAGYSSRRARVVMGQLKDSFSSMVDTLSCFLESEK